MRSQRGALPVYDQRMARILSDLSRCALPNVKKTKNLGRGMACTHNLLKGNVKIRMPRTADNFEQEPLVWCISAARS